MAHIETVLGPIAPEELGLTAMHEHIQFGMPGWELDPWVEYDRAVEFEKIKNDLVGFREAGGRTLVDCSGMTTGRDVEFYQNLSRSSGVHIVACTGFWADPAIPPHMKETGQQPHGVPLKGVDFFTELFLSELTQGMIMSEMRRSKSKAGIIKVAIDSFAEKPAPVEEIMFRAAARAAKHTGAAVTTHGITHARRQMEIFREEGLDPSRIIIGHCSAGYAIDLERDKEIARWGAYVGYDHIGYEPTTSNARYALPDERRVELVKAMVEAGFVERIIISCDTNGRSLSRPTPQHTYAYLLRSFVPRLRQAGITEEQIHTMLVENPRRILPMG